jgi:hypothetical protein
VVEVISWVSSPAPAFQAIRSGSGGANLTVDDLLMSGLFS